MSLSLLRASAGHPDAHCFLNIAGVCTMEGNVLCHIRLKDFCGMGMKPPDYLGAFGCSTCHIHFDSNGTRGLKRGSEEWLFYALRGMARTHQFWHEHGYLKESNDHD
jgi:hypothetical protein